MFLKRITFKLHSIWNIRYTYTSVSTTMKNSETKEWIKLLPKSDYYPHLKKYAQNSVFSLHTYSSKKLCFIAISGNLLCFPAIED